MNKTIKVLPISDLHGNFVVLDYIISNWSSKYVGVDLITISGDVHRGSTHEPIELVDAMESFQQAVNVPIVIIQGNHDYWSPEIFHDSKDIHVLHNSGVEICGLKIWGSPYTKNFLDWNWMLADGVYGLDNIFLNMMPDSLDILLSHGPPFGYGDTCRYGAWENTPDDHLGSHSVYDGIKMHKPRFVFCGHFHTGIRHTVIDQRETACIRQMPKPPDYTHVYNVSCLDEQYKFLGDNPEPETVDIVVDI